MDNLAHSLAGVVLARIAEERLRDKYPQVFDSSIGKKLPFIFGLTGVVVSNLPDLDLIYTWMTPGPLGYLLHHRGHTHTLVLLPLLAVLWLGILRLTLLRKQTMGQNPRLWRSLFVLAMTALVVHLLMDFPNNYGIHPFWPFYNGWFYGDFMFIVEPWLWLVLLGTVAGMARYRLTIAFCLVTMCGVLVLAYTSQAVPTYLQLLMLFWIPAYTAVQIFWLEQLRAKLGLGLVLLGALYGAFALGSTWARGEYKQLNDRFGASGEAAEHMATVLTPQPGNPFCWNYIGMGLLGRDDQSPKSRSWYLHKGLLPLQAQALCSPLTQMAANEQWLEVSTEPLIEQYQRDCHVRAFFQFVRAPFWLQTEDSGGVWRWSDQRYSRSAEVGFSDVFVGQIAEDEGEVRGLTSYRDTECPPWLTNWTPPRADLLDRLGLSKR